MIWIGVELTEAQVAIAELLLSAMLAVLPLLVLVALGLRLAWALGEIPRPRWLRRSGDR